LLNVNESLTTKNYIRYESGNYQAGLNREWRIRCEYQNEWRGTEMLSCGSWWWKKAEPPHSTSSCTRLVASAHDSDTTQHITSHYIHCSTTTHNKEQHITLHLVSLLILVHTHTYTTRQGRRAWETTSPPTSLEFS
jgi:hypothetical protein